MLYPATELAAKPSVDAQGGPENHAYMAKSKVKNAQRSTWGSKDGKTTLYESIEREGVKNPVVGWREKGINRGIMTIGNGNHRVQVSADIMRNTGRHIEVPVIHDEKDYMGQSASFEPWPAVRHADASDMRY